MATHFHKATRGNRLQVQGQVSRYTGLTEGKKTVSSWLLKENDNSLKCVTLEHLEPPKASSGYDLNPFPPSCWVSHPAD